MSDYFKNGIGNMLISYELPTKNFTRQCELERNLKVSIADLLVNNGFNKTVIFDEEMVDELVIQAAEIRLQNVPTPVMPLPISEERKRTRQHFLPVWNCFRKVLLRLE